MEEHKNQLHTDSLQQLHAMYNLNEILSSKPEGVDPTLRDEQLPTQVVRITVFYPKYSDTLNPFMPSGLFYLKSLDRSISYIRGVWLVFIITVFF